MKMTECKIVFILIICISALFEASGHGIDNPVIEVSTSFPPGRECIARVSVVGKGFSDFFDTPCSDDKAQAITRNEYFIFGNPKKRTFCLFTDEWNNLIVINGNTCRQKSYKMENGAPQIYSRQMSGNDCQNIKNFMAIKLERAQKPLTPTTLAPSTSRSGLPPKSGFPFMTNQPNNGRGSSSSPSLTSKPSEAQDQPIVRPGPVPEAAYNKNFFASITTVSQLYSGTLITIVIQGFGINERLEEKCSKGFKPRLLRSDSTLIIKDPNNDDMALFSNDPTTLVIVRNGQCAKRRYTFGRGGTTIAFEKVADKECADVKRSLAETPNKPHPLDMFPTDIMGSFNENVADYQRQMGARLEMMIGRGRGRGGW